MTRILVVDDEREIAHIVGEVLADEGYEVRVAANGREALRQVADFDPQVIVTDYMMPVMDGATLYREVQRQPAYQAIRFIVMSAVTSLPADLQSASFVAKPFTVEMLLATVSRVISSQ
jgi:CheY-like chemotaxis protein